MGTQDAKREAASERRARKAAKAQGGVLDSIFAARSEGAADWGNASPERLLDVVTAMQGLGGAVTFGLSRDGGAYMLTLLLDGNRKTDWLPQSEDIDAWLEQWVYMLHAASDGESLK